MVSRAKRSTPAASTTRAARALRGEPAELGALEVRPAPGERTDAAVGDAPLYLTATELARHLRLNLKKIYALVQAGRLPAVRVSGKWLFPREAIDRWLAEHTVYPREGLIHTLLDQLIVLQGSDDWLLDRAVERLREEHGLTVLTASVGSMAGLRAVAEQRAHVATCHVKDDDVRTVVPAGAPWYLVTLSVREQGLMVPRALRRQVRGMGSVVERGLRFADRQPSAGTHRLARRLVADSGAPPAALRISGTHCSHLEVGMAVRTGAADVGLGIRVAAERCGLEFVPIGTETFELAIPASVLGHARGALFLDRLLDAIERAGRGHVPGYNLASLGRLRAAPNRAA